MFLHVSHSDVKIKGGNVLKYTKVLNLKRPHKYEIS